MVDEIINLEIEETLSRLRSINEDLRTIVIEIVCKGDRNHKGFCSTETIDSIIHINTARKEIEASIETIKTKVTKCK